jgi:hypothetical protein
MGWSKQQFIEQAFAEIGLAGYVFDLSPEQLQTALRQLDSMVASWNALGIRLGYPLPGSPQYSDISAETNVPDSSNEAIYLNLASRIGAGFGKQISPETKQFARMAYNTLLSLSGVPPEMQLPGTLPSGAGNKPWRTTDDPFLTRPIDPIYSGPDGIIGAS